MLYPSIKELIQKNNVNRYELVIATAKCARLITDFGLQEAENLEKLHAKTDGEKGAVQNEFLDEKAVKIAISKLKDNEFSIIHPR